MNLENMQYRTHSLFQEIQVGSFSVRGNFPVLVYKHLEKIFRKTERPLFVAENYGIQIILDKEVDPFENQESGRIMTWILDPLFVSPDKIPSKLNKNVSWFSINGEIFSDYRGTYARSNHHEVIYTRDGISEAYKLSAQTKITRELVAAICAARESGLRQEEIRSALKDQSPTHNNLSLAPQA